MNRIDPRLGTAQREQVSPNFGTQVDPVAFQEALHANTLNG
jgi:hypothetical protein